MTFRQMIAKMVNKTIDNLEWKLAKYRIHTILYISETPIGDNSQKRILYNRRISRRKHKTRGDAKPKNNDALKKSDSNDSIGSASDLRAREEEEIDEKEDSETMTVNDSVLTCGSSAYHAECESMAREELPASRRYPRMANLPENTELDTLFVGHSYGDKPLLADDELDKGDNISPAPLIDMNDEQKELKEEDVFSLAPFGKNKKRKDDSTSQDLLISISPNVAEGSLVDLGDDKFSFHSSKRGSNSSYSEFDAAYQAAKQDFETTAAFIQGVDVVADNNPFSASFNPPLNCATNESDQFSKTKEDLFGAVPFDRMAVSVTNSSGNRSEIDDFINFATDIAEPESTYYMANPSPYSTRPNEEYNLNAGINNMSFEDHTNVAEYVEPAFPAVKQNTMECGPQLFFQPNKSNNPFF